MLPLLRVTVGALATARLTRLVTEDVITQPLRDVVLPNLPGKLQYLAQCRWCMSFWAGLPVAAAVVRAEHHPRPLVATTLLALAYSHLTGLLEELER